MIICTPFKIGCMVRSCTRVAVIKFSINHSLLKSGFALCNVPYTIFIIIVQPISENIAIILPPL